MNRYAGALWIAAHASNYHALEPRRQTFDLVVIHITDGGSKAGPVAEMFGTPKLQRDPPVASSAHFVVGQTGEIIQCVDLGDVAYHASHVNARSVGVEHCARSPHELSATDPGMVPSAVQLATSARLVAWLLTVAGLPADRDHVKGHHEASPQDGHDDCPDIVWRWERYMALVAAAMTTVA